jgi:predicted lipid-binding transport protein (Tim44 family)
MPLSEHEQRLLAQMEQALYAEDPKFATSLRAARGRGSRGKAAGGVLAVLAGLGLVLAGVATTMAALGVAGFLVMLLGAVLVYSAFGAAPAAVSATDEVPTAPTAAKPARSDFMTRMEERWRKRHEEGQ